MQSAGAITQSGSNTLDHEGCGGRVDLDGDDGVKLDGFELRFSLGKRQHKRARDKMAIVPNEPSFSKFFLKSQGSFFSNFHKPGLMLLTRDLQMCCLFSRNWDSVRS